MSIDIANPGLDRTLVQSAFDLYANVVPDATISPLLPALSTDVPTVTFVGPGGSAPVTGGTAYGYSTAPVTFGGSVPELITALSRNYYQNKVNAGWTPPPYFYEFDYYGTDLDIRFRPANATPLYWIWVDDKPTTAAPVAGVGLTSNNLYYMRMVFGATTWRKIRVYQYLADFGGMDIASGDIVLRTANHILNGVAMSTLPRLAFLGDSYFEGTSQLTSMIQSIPLLTGFALNMQVFNGGQGGTGWTNTGGGGGKAVFGDATRLNRIIQTAPHVLVVGLSINDNGRAGTAPGDITTAVQSGLQTLYAALPNTKFVVTGVEDPVAASSPTANAVINNNAGFAGADASGVPYTKIDPMNEGWYTTANLSSIIGADGTHVKASGAEFWSRQIGERGAAISV